MFKECLRKARMKLGKNNMPKKKVPRRIKKVIEKEFPLFGDTGEISNLTAYTFLKAEDILSFFMNRSSRLNFLMEEAERGEKKIMTTDFALYEAVWSARGNIEISFDKLRMFLWNVMIVPQSKEKISRERMNEIRRVSFGGL